MERRPFFVPPCLEVRMRFFCSARAAVASAVAATRAAAAAVAVATLAVPGPASAEDLGSLLGWLEGEWEREIRGGTAVERWHVVSGNTIEGSASVTRDGETRVTEYLALQRFGGEFFYVAKPVANDFPTPFRLVETGERFVFENPAYDFPQRLIYTPHGEDRLTVRIEGVEGEEVRGFDLEFRRAAE